MLLILSSCNINDKDNVLNIDVTDTISLDVDSKPIHALKRSSNFVNQKIIKLELCENSIIGEFSKLECDNDSNFYILDKISKAIFKFDFNGAFLFRIQDIGNGPGEYTIINDFCLTDSAIVILDTHKNIVNFHSCVSGKFIKEVPLPPNIDPRNFSYVGNSTLAFCQFCYKSSEPKERLVFYNLKTSQVAKSLYMTNIENKYRHQFYFYNNNNKVYFCLPYTNYGLNIRNNSDTSNLFFDFGKHNLPLSYKDNNNVFDSKILKEKNCVEWIDNIIEADDIIAFRYGYGKYVYTAWYSRKNKITYSTIFDQGKPILLYESPKAAIGDYFIGTISPVTFVKMRPSVNNFGEKMRIEYQKQLNDLPKNFEDILKECDVNDNPYILLYKVKM